MRISALAFAIAAFAAVPAVANDSTAEGGEIPFEGVARRLAAKAAARERRR
jgi:hypothetical protein